MAMRFEHEFTVPVPVDQAWPVLLDVERIAPCLPGAAVDKIEDDSFTGRMKMRIGPITVTYQGRAAFEKVDEDTRSMTIRASGKEARGPGTAGVTVVARLHPDGRNTRVTVDTSLNVTGRPAQFGRGVMAEVGGKLVDRFAANLSRLLGEGPGVETADETTAGTAGVGGWSAPPVQEPASTGPASTGPGDDDVPAISDTWGPGPARPADADSSREPTGSTDSTDSADSAGSETVPAAPAASTGPAGSTASGAESPGTTGSAFPGPAGSTGHGPEGHEGTAASGGTAPGAAAFGLGGPGGPESLNGPEIPGGPGRHLSAVPTPPGLVVGEEAESRQSHPAGTSRTSLSPDEEALNLLEVAGLPLLKRVAPLVAALTGIVLLAWLIRRALRH
ncbi:SRPBCC domain-containing protein [Streptosporangium sp. NPDC002524]|uniref:SRPBCC domain-containing protein n=1 Tax=Streptosporangium sp. NPDC002524 TaxID=3154537 RepID=UPI0033321A49